MYTNHCAWVCMLVCVCVREREREVESIDVTLSCLYIIIDEISLQNISLVTLKCKGTYLIRYKFVGVLWIPRVRGIFFYFSNNIKS